MLHFLSFYAVIHENEKRMPCTLVYKSYGMQILDALGSYFRFLVKSVFVEKTKKPKKPKKNL